MRRAGMVAAPRSYPGDAGLARFLNGEFRGPFHDQVAQPVITVYQRGARTVVYDSNVWAGIDSAGFDLRHILLQPEDAMGIPAARVGTGHQGAPLASVLV